MQAPTLDSLFVRFFSQGRWQGEPVLVTDPSADTLRYDNIPQHGRFFWREVEMWTATEEPWRLFGVPATAITASERKFHVDYVDLVARTATELCADPGRAPVCVPQLLFHFLDEERLEREAAVRVGGIPVLTIIQPTPHPADISFFCGGQWRVLEIDGASHETGEGMRQTKRRDAMYGTVPVRMAVLEGDYEGRIVPMTAILDALGIDLHKLMAA